MNFDIIRLELKTGILHQVAILIKQKPELFERINLRDYASNAWLGDLETDGNIAYRFYWEDIC